MQSVFTLIIQSDINQFNDNTDNESDYYRITGLVSLNQSAHTRRRAMTTTYYTDEISCPVKYETITVLNKAELLALFVPSLTKFD